MAIAPTPLGNLILRAGRGILGATSPERGSGRILGQVAGRCTDYPSAHVALRALGRRSRIAGEPS